MWIDVSNTERVCLNANIADKLGTKTVGNINTPIYLNEGIPIETESMLPLIAGEDYKLVGALGLTEGIMYDMELPPEGFEGQLFFLENNDIPVPKGGDANYTLVKNSIEDGDIGWKNPKITWVNGTATGPKPKLFNIEGDILPAASPTTSGIITTNSQIIIGEKTFNNKILVNNNIEVKNGNIAVNAENNYNINLYTSNKIVGLKIEGNTSKCGLFDYTNEKWIVSSDGTETFLGPTEDVYVDGEKKVLMGAAWNDYAEYRICNGIFKPGQVVCENNDDTVSISTYRMQPGACIVSDTFGFAIGKTKNAKCPIAVSGRVLAYTYESREEFCAGDAVCAGPNGTVSKMTREEIKEYPERVIGTVSAVPSYETWGQNNIKVNKRIWIKVV